MIASTSSALSTPPSSTTTKTTLTAPAVVLATAAALRALVYPLAAAMPPLGDARANLALAEAWARHGAFVTTPFDDGVRPPLLRWALAPLLDLSTTPAGTTPGVPVFMLLCELLTCALLMTLTRREFGARAGLAAGWLHAIFAPCIFWTSAGPWAEIPAISAATVTLALVLHVRRCLARGEPSRRAAVGLGLSFGAGVLLKQTLVGVALVGAFALLRERRVAVGRRVRAVGLAVVTAAVVVAPWTAFTAQRYGQPMVSGNFGQFALMFDNAPEGVSARELWQRADGARERAALSRRVFVDALVDTPELVARRAVQRVRALLGPEVSLGICVALADGEAVDLPDDSIRSVRHAGWRRPVTTRAGRVQLLCAVATVLLGGLAAAGLVASSGSLIHRVAVTLLGLLFVVALLTVASERYRLLAVPFLAPFAGLALADWGHLSRRARWTGALVAAALAVTQFVLPAP